MAFFEDKQFEGIPANTMWMDLTIAERFGMKAIKDTVKNLYEFARDDYKMLTGFALVANAKAWVWYDKPEGTPLKKELVTYYSDLYYAIGKNFDKIYGENKEAEQFYFEMTD